MKPNEKQTVSQWSGEGTQLAFEAYDNGDGDGPHYYAIKLSLDGNCGFWGSFHINVNNKQELKALADAVNKAVYFEGAQ
jgi:hypothetical protein